MRARLIQQMLDSGQVDEQLETHVLEEASASLSQRMYELRQRQSWCPTVKATQKRYEALEGRILAILNQRHGVDGMTHLTG